MNMLFTHLLLAQNIDVGGGAAAGAPLTTSTWGACLGGDSGTIAQITCIIPLFTNVVNAALIFGGTVAVIMFIYGGLRMVLSGGDAKQAGAARQIVTYAIIGLIVVLLSFTLLQFISYVTGVNCIQNFGDETKNGTDFFNCLRSGKGPQA